MVQGGEQNVSEADWNVSERDWEGLIKSIRAQRLCQNQCHNRVMTAPIQVAYKWLHAGT